MFGVPFDVALRQLLSVSSKRRIVKSLFKRLDAERLESEHRGIVATMVAHLSTDVGISGSEISLEAWQV